MSDRAVGIVALLLIAGFCALYIGLQDAADQLQAEDDAARAAARAEEVQR